MFRVNQLQFDYSEKPLLENITFSVPAGTLLHLQGPNGAGKTTLLKLLVGMVIPLAGDICFEGNSIYEDLSLYQQSLCYIGHKLGISLLLTARENYQFELKKHVFSVDFKTLVTRLALNELEDIPCRLLSAGQKRRVGLMRLLMTNTKVWFLDEPFVALDHASMTILKTIMEQHLLKGGCIILTSHQPLPNFVGHYQEYQI